MSFHRGDISQIAFLKNPSLNVHVISCLVKCFHCLAVSFSLFLCCYLLCCSTSNRLWAEDSTEKEKDSVPTAVTVPVAPSVVNAAATTTAMTTATSGTVSSTSEVRERRRCVKVLRVMLLLYKSNLIFLFKGMCCLPQFGIVQYEKRWVVFACCSLKQLATCLSLSDSLVLVDLICETSKFSSVYFLLSWVKNWVLIWYAVIINLHFLLVDYVGFLKNTHNGTTLKTLNEKKEKQ